MKKDSMLAKALKQFTGGDVATEAVASDATAALQAEFDTFKATTEAETAELSAALTTALTAVADADAKVAEAQAQVADLQAQLSQFKTEAEAKRLTARKEKIVAAVGTARADALMAATEKVDDASFETVFSALVASAAVEDKSKLFVEQGVDAQADAGKTVAVESATMKIVKQRVAAGAHVAA